MQAFHLFMLEIRPEMEDGKLQSVLKRALSARLVERHDPISHSYFQDMPPSCHSIFFIVCDHLSLFLGDIMI